MSPYTKELLAGVTIGIVIYPAFVGLIAFAVWYTHSAWCLWALLLAPSYTVKADGDKHEEANS